MWRVLFVCVSPTLPVLFIYKINIFHHPSPCLWEQFFVVVAAAVKNALLLCDALPFKIQFDGNETWSRFLNHITFVIFGIPTTKKKKYDTTENQRATAMTTPKSLANLVCTVQWSFAHKNKNLFINCGPIDSVKIKWTVHGRIPSNRFDRPENRWMRWR